MKRKPKKPRTTLTRQQYDEVTLLIQELDLVPMEAFPPETHKIVREYYTKIVYTDTFKDFDPITQIGINELLRNRRHLKEDNTTQLELFIPCV